VSRHLWLVIGGWLSLAAATLHLGCIFGGEDWYRFFGAGEGIARAAERGSWTPPLMALGIAALLTIFALYAFAGARLIRRLPLMRAALVAISAIYLLRGLVIVYPAAMARPDLSDGFMIWSSLVVLVYGVVYAVGTWRAWPQLNRRKEAHAVGS
jgi:hypothetical protein